MATDLRTKLQIRAGMRGKVINQPAELDVATAVGAGRARSDLDYALVFVNNSADVSRYCEQALTALRDDGILWFAFPKKSSGLQTDISRDTGWTPLAAAAYRPVRSVSIDETWSALRFREISRVRR